jgi:hypothetical protein
MSVGNRIIAILASAMGLAQAVYGVILIQAIYVTPVRRDGIHATDRRSQCA